ncbi:PEP-CTERM sorting domain-containing protein [Undibacterium sp. SXout20W]|uniref:PEP-CTERM sorting domain-containing protein n=1 Tax=Undibacterium sp. SXout20W TaxID=3413051 RepID=UPI003BF14E6C
MKNVISKFLSVAVVALTTLGTANANVVYTNTPNGSSIGNISGGNGGNTTTYGEIFTAPSAATSLDSISFWLQGTGTNYYYGVATWTGGGAGSALFTSAAVSGAYSSFTEVTVATGGLNLVAGQKYVAYLSSAGLAGTGYDTVERGTKSSIDGGMAWDNSGGKSPNNNANWNGNHGTSYVMADVLTFSSSQNVPEPESMALVGLGLLGLCLSRRKAKQA